ncbi:MAG TPA: hypothetical protein VND15_03270 [Candidatus Acidoferrales bacterium]|nr:hypothetical protein [Candidatus Acidoferrales bacterium]
MSERAKKQERTERVRAEWEALHDQADSLFRNTDDFRESLNISLKARAVAVDTLKSRDEIFSSNDQLIRICNSLIEGQKEGPDRYRSLGFVIRMCGLATGAAQSNLNSFSISNNERGLRPRLSEENAHSKSNLQSNLLSMRKREVNMLFKHAEESESSKEYSTSIWAYKQMLYIGEKFPPSFHDAKDLNKRLYKVALLEVDDTKAAGHHSKEFSALNVAIETAPKIGKVDKVKSLKRRAISAGVKAAKVGESESNYDIAHSFLKTAIGYAWDIEADMQTIGAIRIRINTCMYMLGKERDHLVRQLDSSM